MAKRSWGECDELPLAGSTDRCEDFSPSYDTQRLARKAQRDEDEGPLFEAVNLLTGIPTDQLRLSMRLGADLKLDDEDLPLLLDTTGYALPSGVDPSLLLATGRLVDLLVPRDPETMYRAQVARCAELVDDERAFRAAGCKREGHLMLPQGRLGFRPGSYEGEKEKEPGNTQLRPGKKTKKRWKAKKPPLGARTQSPAAHARAQERARGKARDLFRLADEIQAGLLQYARQSSADPRSVQIPHKTRPLEDAGIPRAAARFLVKKMGGTHITIRLPTAPEDYYDDVLKRITRLFGDASYAKDVGDSLGFNLAGASLRRVRGPVRASPGMRKLLARLKGKSRPKRAVVQRQFLPIREIRIGNKVVYPSPEETDNPLGDLRRAVRAATKGSRWTLFLTVGDVEPFQTVKLQHSVLFGPKGAAYLPDYTTLRGFSLPELSSIIARKVLSEDRRARSDTPAKKNPVSTVVLTPDQIEGLEVGDARLYKRGITPDRDLYIYNSKKRGPQVVTAKRLKTWLALPFRRDAASARRMQEDERRADTPLSSTPLLVAANPRRNPPMPKYPLYHDEVLSTDPTLNRLTDYYYPGTIWDYYEEGAFGQYNVSVPVNRRNPSKRKGQKKGLSEKSRAKFRRVATRAQQIAKASGCDFSSAMREAWREEKSGALGGSRAAANPRKQSKRSKAHRARHHRYRDSGHAARAKKAMEFKHGYGISLKDAWAHVKAGTTPSRAAANPRVTWPRNNQWQDVEGPYGHGMSTPVNRRNPRGRQTIARRSEACPNCGDDMYGSVISVVGKDPRGRKIWACC